MGVKRRGVNTHLVGPKGAKKFEGRNDYENPGTRVFAAKPTPEGWPLGGEGMVTAEKDPEMKKVKVEMFRVGKGWILKELGCTLGSIEKESCSRDSVKL